MMIAILFWLLAGGVYLWAFSKTELSFDIAKHHFDKDRDKQKKHSKNVIFLKYYDKLTIDKFHKWKWFSLIVHSPIGVIIAMCHLAQLLDIIYIQNRD